MGTGVASQGSGTKTKESLICVEENSDVDDDESNVEVVVELDLLVLLR